MNKGATRASDPMTLADRKKRPPTRPLVALFYRREIEFERRLPVYGLRVLSGFPLRFFFYFLGMF